jgi:aryl-alcohol dehydrogenase-like predicted oxidoreductase
MTFGTDWGWGADEGISRKILHRYLDAGGNLIDTANGYTNGTSETMLGKFLKQDGLRERVVLATKFTFNTHPGDPNAGGNGRKNVYESLEASLKRLQTDYIDLYWLHAWDTVTPVEEVVATLSELVRSGKIRYYGFSDTPAWYVARAQTLAEQQSRERLIALQLEYSLIERSIEREHIPAAQELGLAVCPWSPLASGFLAGKYKREGASGRGDGRLTTESGNIFPRFTDRNWRILDTLVNVAKQVGRSPAQVALNWVATRPGVTSTIIGATKTTQLDDNLAALDFEIPATLRARLDEVSALEPVHPYVFFTTRMQTRITGETSIERWMPARVTGGPEEQQEQKSGEPALEKAS